MTLRDLFWVVFGTIAILTFVAGVDVIKKQLFDIEAAVRLQTAQQTYLIERIASAQNKVLP